MAQISTEFIKSVVDIKDLPNTGFPEIVFSGKSNVGKSSLINSLTNNKKLAKISSKPGKTKSINYFLINKKYYYVDLPGYGYANIQKQYKYKIWQVIDDYLTQSNNIKLIVQLIDSRHFPPTKNDIEMFEWLTDFKKNFIIVLTKSDKLKKNKLIQTKKNFHNFFKIDSQNIILFSNKNKNSVFNLKNILPNFLD